MDGMTRRLSDTRSASPAAHAFGAARRGSVLVLVVGVLALMALIVLVYSTIGMSDRRASSALTDRTRVVDQGRAFADYVARVIGDSTTAVVAQRVPEPTNGFRDLLMRRTWDVPGADWALQSQPDSGAPWRRFQVTGGIRTTWESNQLDPRMGLVPWLSAAEPAWLDAGQVKLSNVNSPYYGQDAEANAAVYAHQFRDLRYVSIFSPDGRRVNKRNLRGNFDVEPGIGYTASGTPQSSQGLFLLDPTDKPDVYLTGPFAASGLVADPNVPHQWLTNLYGIHRPVGLQPLNATAADILPGGQFNLDNLYADADGDGFYDSPWFEMYDTGEAALGVSPKLVIPQSGSLRWVYAAKAIDLSGLANINTALSFRATPTEANPAGATPADVDLERLLAMRDTRRAFREAYFSGQVTGVVNVPQPGTPPRAQDRQSNYRGYDDTTGDASELIGRGALAAVVTARQTGTPELNRSFAPTDIPSASWTPTGIVDAAARAKGYTQYFRSPRGAVAGGAATPEARTYATAFSADDEIELRTYHGLNDPARTSALEITIDGRAQDPALSQLGPMRSNRKFDFERPPEAFGDLVLAGQATALLNTSPRRDLTTISGARTLRTSTGNDLRVARLTPISGFAEQDVTPLPLQDEEVAPSASNLLDSILSTSASAQNDDPSNSVHKLFRAYLDALSPELGAFNRADPAQDMFAPLNRMQAASYGHRVDAGGSPIGGNSAEVAIRTAATMATNLVAERAFGQGAVSGGGPQGGPNTQAADDLVLSLLLLNSDTQANYTVPGTIPFFDFWGTASPPASNSLVMMLRPDRELNGATPNDLRRPILANNAVASQTIRPLDAKDALAIFGVRPQPFVTQAAYMVMYSNSYFRAGNDGRSSDQEWDTATNAPGVATIDGEIRDGNDDFQFELIAFQLTNPFDREIALSHVSGTGQPIIGTIAPEDFRYYFEFNGRFFKVVNGGDDGLISEGVTLKPGESRVFYYTTYPLTQIAARWNRAANSPSPAFTVDDVREWINFQLSVRVARDIEPVRMVEFDPTRGPSSPLGVDLFAGGTPDGQKVVRLWRKVVGGSRDAGTNADLENDYLVDRLRDFDATGPATTPTLDVRMRPTKVTIAGSQVPNPALDPTAYLDTRFSITLFASIRRPDDPSAGTGAMLKGVFPACAIESKGTSPEMAQVGYNLREVMPGFDPKNGSFPQSFFRLPLRQSLGWGATRLDGNTGLIETQTTRDTTGDTGLVPRRVLVNSIGASALQRHTTGTEIPKSLDESNQRDQGLAFDEQYVPIRFAPRARTLRPSELIGALAVSATFDPVRYANGRSNPGGRDPREAAIDEGWTTLSEALALATNYASARSDQALWYQPANPQHGFVWRGQIVTDRFTPFNDLDSNGIFTQTPTATIGSNGVNSAYMDPHRGAGLPFAWNILNNLRCNSLGSLRSMVHGLVNVNTAPLSVLRALPMLTLDYQTTVSGSDTTWTELAQLNTAIMFDPSRDTWDIASTIVAYRDHATTFMRGLRAGVPTGLAVDFTQSAGGAARYDASSFAAGMSDLEGRRLVTGFLDPTTNVGQALREAPGFMSPAELLGVRISKSFDFVGPNVGGSGENKLPVDDVRRADVSIDRLGRRAELPSPPASVRERVVEIVAPDPGGVLVYPGLVPNWRRDTDPTTGAWLKDEPAQVPDSLDAKMAIADAVLNTVSVRSDVFCVWFVLEGYSRADVEQLDFLGSPTFVGSPGDDAITRPMVPTVSRRYVMVVDRSNVTAPGQKPRILLLQELPR